VILSDVSQIDSAAVKINTAVGFSDVDSNNVFTYSASGLPTGLSIDATTGLITGSLAANASQGGTGGVYSIVITATDSTGTTVSQSFNFTASNTAPTATPDTVGVTENTTFTANAVSGVINGAVLAGDTDANGDPLTVIGVRIGVASSATDVGSANIGSVLVGTYGILAMNADGSYSYSADHADRLDVGATVTEIFSYAISDGKGGTAFATLTIILTGINDAPTAVGTLPDFSQVDSTSVNIAIATGFNDLDSNNVFSYSASGLPSGLSIDTATGLISGILAANASQGGASGVYSIVVTAKDSAGVIVTQTFNFTALPVPVPLSVTNIPVILNDALTSGSLMMLSNPSENGNGLLGEYNELEKKDWHINNNFADDNSLPPVHLSLYVPIRHHVISLTGSLRDQVVLELERYSFAVPRWAFRHTDPNEQLEFEAAHPDGSALPEWLKFNPKTLRFSGLAPKGATDQYVMVTARDTYGNEVHTIFTVHVNRDTVRPAQKPVVIPNKALEKNKLGEKPATVAKSALSEQVHAVGKLSKLQESRALIDSLKQLQL
jgi:VCBS repeat-containing protein